MISVIRLISLVLFLVTLPLYPVFYLLCRLQAKPCPACDEDWYTELTGEWDGEDWHCMRCNHYWNEKYEAKSG